MNTHRTTSAKYRAAAAITLATALATLLIGCAGEEEKREYAVPSNLCGITVNSEDLAPFLPAGKDISVRDKSYAGAKGCQVAVDKKLILTTAQTWLEEGRTTAYFAARQSFDTPEQSADEGRFRYSGNQAFGKTQKCVDAKYKQELYTAIQAEGSEHKDAQAMKRLIVVYTEEVEDSAECKAGAE
ncbi:hypothetical protein [Streptomyces sp. NPDC001381]|uniref:hypothetical protein n=1 Tax=Streptomyces sp. NPDC001381 TaxID=3364567 RepID=UPI0036CFBFD8